MNQNFKNMVSKLGVELLQTVRDAGNQVIDDAVFEERVWGFSRAVDAQTFCDPLRCHCGPYPREKRDAVPLPPRRRSCIHLYVPNPLQGYSACRFRSHGRMSYRQLSQLNSEWDNSGENELLNRLNKVSAFAVNLLFNTLYHSFRVLQYVIYLYVSGGRTKVESHNSKTFYILLTKSIDIFAKVWYNITVKGNDGLRQLQYKTAVR